jgi:hypothetical protein
MNIQQRLHTLIAITKPTIHRNGTGKDELMESLLNAMEAINNAIKALNKTSPNGRDYYPQGDDAIRVAGQEHKARIKQLETINKELEELAMHIHKQPDNR